MISLKEETKGHAEVVWGNKFSTIAGSSTSVTIGAKNVLEVSASNSLRFGIKNSFEYGPSFVYHCGPEFQKASEYAPNTDTSFGAANTKFGQKLNWANAKITFSDIKEHKFFIAKEGSTSMFTTNKLYSETGFTAGAGYGLVATTGYKVYCETVKTCRTVMTAMTILPVVVSLLQNLFSGPGAKDGAKAPITLNSYAGMAINIGATLGPALTSLVAAVNAVAAREGFKNAIKPLTVMDMHKEKGLFIGSDHGSGGLVNGLKMSKEGVLLGNTLGSAMRSAFSKDGDLKFGKLTDQPDSALAMGTAKKANSLFRVSYLANQSPVVALLASAGGDMAAMDKQLETLKPEHGDLFLIGQRCRITAPKITLTDIDPSQSDTEISLKGGHNNAKKSIELRTKKDQSISLTEKAMTVKTGKKTKLSLQDEDFSVKIGKNMLIRMNSGALVLKTSNNKLVMSSSATKLNGSNLKVMA